MMHFYIFDAGMGEDGCIIYIDRYIYGLEMFFAISFRILQIPNSIEYYY